MSWVRQAIDNIKAQPYEELYPTAYGGSAKEPDIFWALSTNDVPPPVKEAVEKEVRQQTLKSSLTCAIIRLETLGGYYTENKGASTDEAIGHFSIYLGTSPANTKFESHLSTDLGNPPKTSPKPPPTNGPRTDEAASHCMRMPGGIDEDYQYEGARTPSMGEIEGEYGRVEERSKSSGKRLSKITANLENWMRLK